MNVAMPAAEADRLDALRRTEILDTPPEAAFDDLARLARTVCHAPFALVSLVDEDRVWFKAKLGINAPEVPRQGSFCSQTVAVGDVLIVRDTLEDARFADNPLVTSPPHIRFYAGVPVRIKDHQAVGALCVLDVVPRDLSEDQLKSLRGLAHQVAVQIQFRRWAADIATSVKDAWGARVQLEIERALLCGVLRAATEYSIIGTDPSGVIMVFNEGAERMLGYHSAEVVGRETPNIVHDPAEVARRAAELGIEPGFNVFIAVARRGEAETREWTYVRKDGTRFPVSLTVTAMRDAVGTLTGYIGIARDLTAERRAERERDRFLVERTAREAAERAVDRLSRLHAVASALASSITPAQVVDVVAHQARTALGASTCAVALLREDGHTLELVAALGYPEEVTEAQRCFPVTAEVPLAAAVRSGSPILLPTLEACCFPAWTVESRKALAASPIFLNGKPLGGLCLSFAEPRVFKEEDRLFLLALGRQCAQALERSRLYEAEARARAEAEAANRAKDEFLSMLSHELRTPLTAVLGWVHILQKRPQADAATARGLAVMERNATAQLRLIEDILDISRIVAGKIELQRGVVDLASLVRGAVEAARPAAEGAKLTVVVEIDPEVGAVSADPDRIQQVVGNLLSNAIKFSRRSGRIEVRLRRAEDRAVLQVTDDGEGIAPEFLPFVFERFRQAESSRKRAHGGLGLGLSIAKHLVELHGGEILAESAGRGRGTTITVRLPLHDHEARAARDACVEP